MKGRLGFTALLLLIALFGSVVWAGPAQNNRIDLSGQWKFSTDPYNKGGEKGWNKANFNSSTWRTLKVPGYWEDQGVTASNPSLKDQGEKPYNGYAWYRRAVTVPKEWKGRTIYLNLGKVDDNDWTYLNGAMIGSTASTDPSECYNIRRRYVLPDSVVKFGQPNVIAVRVQDTGWEGGIAEGPVSLTLDKPDERTVSPAGEPSETYQDAVQVGSDVFINKGKTVNDAISTFGNVTVAGHVARDAVSVFGTVKILPGGSVGRDAVASMGTVRILSGGKVGRDAVGVGGGVQKDPGAEVGRNTVSVGVGDWKGLELFRNVTTPFGFAVASGLTKLIGALLFALLAMVIAALFPRRMETVSETILSRAGHSALYGIIGMLLILPLAVALVITCIGIPLIAIEIILIMAAWIFGKMGVGLALGERLAEATGHSNLSTVYAAGIGTAIIGLVGMVPFAGGLVVGLLALVGFGAVIITGFGSNPDWWEERRRRRAARSHAEVEPAPSETKAEE